MDFIIDFKCKNRSIKSLNKFQSFIRKFRSALVQARLCGFDDDYEMSDFIEIENDKHIKWSTWHNEWTVTCTHHVYMVYAHSKCCVRAYLFVFKYMSMVTYSNDFKWMDSRDREMNTHSLIRRLHVAHT